MAGRNQANKAVTDKPQTIIHVHEHKPASAETAQDAQRRRLDDRAAIAEQRFKRIQQGMRPRAAASERVEDAPLSQSTPRELRALRKAVQELGEVARPIEKKLEEGQPIEQNEQVAMDFAAETLGRKARRAASAGYIDDPMVQEWMAARRSLGETEDLRKLKNKVPGGTTGVSPQLNLADICLQWIIQTIKAECSDVLTIAQLQEHAKECLRAEDWLPPLLKKGFVHEDVARMQSGRRLDAARRDTLITEARAARQRLFDDLERRVNVTERAFGERLVGLGLHEPRKRRRQTITKPRCPF